MTIGLDTSTILRYLALQGYEIICFLADCGQEEDFEAVKSKALKLGAERMVIQDVQQELIDELVWPAIQCEFFPNPPEDDCCKSTNTNSIGNAIYEDQCKIVTVNASCRNR